MAEDEKEEEESKVIQGTYQPNLTTDSVAKIK
jgi:hypothetical protein